ncbi:MAG: PepSY-associated TM helix domain-containing protein [Myxococcota bacterium]
MKPRTRRLWLDAHLYLGLLCAPYFALYGVTAIAFNHGWRGAETSAEWSAPLPAPLAANAAPAARAAAARDALGLAGHTPPWTAHASADGALAFQVNRPGRRYAVRVAPDGREARVVETRASLLAVARGLHGATSFPGMGWTRAWALYTDVSTAAMALAVVSGAVLHWPRRARLRAGLAGAVLGLLSLVALWSALW